ncbi:MAG: hypothetical protein VW876_07885 [Deltaproteobacteria bacterium]
MKNCSPLLSSQHNLTIHDVLPEVVAGCNASIQSISKTRTGLRDYFHGCWNR